MIKMRFGQFDVNLEFSGLEKVGCKENFQIFNIKFWTGLEEETRHLGFYIWIFGYELFQVHSSFTKLTEVNEEG